MSRTENNEEYLNTPEAIIVLGISKQLFYNNAKPQLRVYRFDAKKQPFYKKSDVISLKEGTTVRKPAIVISGLFKDWSAHVRNLGHAVETVDKDSFHVAPAPENVAAFFGITAGSDVVTRTQLNAIDGEPVCVWVSYYPVSIVKGEIFEEVTGNPRSDVVKLMKEKRGIAITHATDKIGTRLPTTMEQAQLKIVSNEPVFTLDRVSYTDDEKAVLFQSMVLLGSSFQLSYPYQVEHWKD